MTATELIELLKICNGDDIVEIYDPDAEEVLPVTGMTYGGGDRKVHLYSDTD